MNTYPLSILTLEKVIFNGNVRSIIVPGAKGYFQVLSHHAPLLSTLQQGRLEVMTEEGEKHLYTLSGGFIEVARDKTTIFADEIEITPQS